MEKLKPHRILKYLCISLSSPENETFILEDIFTFSVNCMAYAKITLREKHKNKKLSLSFHFI